MSLYEQLSLLQTEYCERQGPGAFAEPVNTITNAAFLIAGILAFREIQKHTQISRGTQALPWMLGVVAIGSALYHTIRSPYTLVIDAVPLFAFILWAIFLLLRQSLGTECPAAIIVTGFVALEILLSAIVPQEFLNGSIRHAFALAFSGFVVLIIARRFGKIAWRAVPVLVFYALAVICRTVDPLVCSSFPIGTHFLWHVFGATASFFVAYLIISIEAPFTQTFIGAKPKPGAI